MKITCTTFAVLSLAVQLAACGSAENSTPIHTDEIFPSFRVETGADGISHATGYFFKDQDAEDPFGGISVDLAGGDTLTVRVDGQEQSFSGPGSGFAMDFDTGTTANTEFDFDFERPDQADAPGSKGTLPAPMELRLPEPGSTYSIANDQIPVAWLYGGSIDNMSIEVDADCLDPDGPNDWWLDEQANFNETGDPGADAISLKDQIIFSDHCKRYAAKLILRRSRQGYVDPAFAPNPDACGGNSGRSCKHLESFWLSQVRTVDINLVP